MKPQDITPPAAGEAAHTPTPKKRKAIALRYNPDGSRIVWYFWREAEMHSTVYGKIASWCWTDESGYTRCGPQTWAEFVPYMRSYFQSYDVTPLQDFS